MCVSFQTVISREQIVLMECFVSILSTIDLVFGKIYQKTIGDINVLWNIDAIYERKTL